MKKTLLTFIVLLFAAFTGESGVIISGTEYPIDTLEYYKVGPGIMYASCEISSLSIKFFTLTTDLKNQYNTVETFQGKDRSTSTEALTSVYNRLSSAGHKCIAGVNGNFWSTSEAAYANVKGTTMAGNMRNGQIITNPNGWNIGHGNATGTMNDIGYVALDENKQLWIQHMGYSSTATLPNGEVYGLGEVNRERGSNELVLFTEYLWTPNGHVTRTTEEGTEVFLKLVEGETWGVNKDVQLKVERILPNSFKNAMQDGEVCLSGVGNAATFLNKLNVGDVIKLNQKIFTYDPAVAGQVPIEYVNARQMVTGNALILKDGELTARCTNEGYNTTKYPRTGNAMSADRNTLFQITAQKGKGANGATCTEIASILKYMGAANASSMDGGGSAQMMVEGSLVSYPSDGTERPVANGLLLFSTAPEDNEIAEIRFHDSSITIPIYSTMNPVIDGYNKYGVLIQHDMPAYTLTCTPEIGKITADGLRLTAGGTQGIGVITAEYNGITTSRMVTVANAQISIRINPILTDNVKEYPIEVTSQIGNNTFSYDPADLTWEIADPNICQINNGVLKGKAIGTTEITGSIGDFAETVTVNVEIPEASSLSLIDNNWEGWTAAVSSGLTSYTFDNGNAKFTQTSARNPNFKLTKKIQLYALPSSIEMTLQNDMLVSNLVLDLRPRNATAANNITFENVPATTGTDQVIKLKIADNFDADDMLIYPLTLESINFKITKADLVTGNTYNINVKSIDVKYDNWISGIICTPTNADNAAYSVYPNPATNGVIAIKGGDGEKATVAIYDAAGKSVMTEAIELSGNTSLNISSLTSGIYFIRIVSENASVSSTIIVK